MNFDNPNEDQKADVAYDCALDEARAEANHLEARLHETQARYAELRERMAELRACARDARHGKTQLERELAASVLVNLVLSEPRGVGTGPNVAEDIGLAAAAQAMSEMRAAENEDGDELSEVAP